MKKFVTADDVASLVKSIQHGRFFSLVFDRALPKCEACGAKSKKWLAGKPTVCPKCGGVISYEREALAQTGVANPKDSAIKPKGVGETFAQKMAKGIVGFYDAKAMGYRECRAENVKVLKFGGDEYYVVK